MITLGQCGPISHGDPKKYVALPSLAPSDRRTHLSASEYTRSAVVRSRQRAPSVAALIVTQLKFLFEFLVVPFNLKGAVALPFAKASG